jgi:hypothetical protein
MPRTLSGRGLLSAWIVLIACAGGCTNHPPAKRPAPGSTPSLAAPSRTAASPDPTAAVQTALDAYRNMWQAYQQALQVPDPSSPELTRYATGRALATLRQGLQSLKDQGLKGTGTISTTPRVTAVSPASDPASVDIADCLNDAASHIVRASPGPAYSDPPGGRRRVSAGIKRQSDGSWKVDDFGVQAVGTC